MIQKGGAAHTQALLTYLALPASSDTKQWHLVLVRPSALLAASHTLSRDKPYPHSKDLARTCVSLRIRSSPRIKMLTQCTHSHLSLGCLRKELPSIT